MSDLDGAIREGEPPITRRTSPEVAAKQPAATWVLKCLWPLALGCLFSGCTATNTVPQSLDFAERVRVFAAMMTGPFCAPILLRSVDFSYSPIAIWQELGILSIGLIAAYPVKRSVITACVSVVGLA